MGGFGNYDVVGYKNLPELQNKIDYIMLRRLKEDVFDLPEKVYIDECLEMTSKQEQIYKEAEQYVRDNIDKIKLSPSPLGALIRLRQATGYPGILSSTITESVKLDRMEEIVDESMLNKRQVVIFSNWTQMTDAIYDRLHQKYTLSLITGDTKDEVRQTNVEQFQNGNSKIIIGTIGAMGTGLTLTAGTVVIFMDHPWNRALYDQAVDRCHRIGQKNSITIYNLMCKDTIDERIWSIVKTKGAISDAVIDGKNTIDLLLGGI
jgi:SNF2 family DNA or RNA helicase